MVTAFIVNQISHHKCDNCAECTEHRRMSLLSGGIIHWLHALDIYRDRKKNQRKILVKWQNDAKKQQAKCFDRCLHTINIVIEGENKKCMYDSARQLNALRKTQRRSSIERLQNVWFIHCAWTAMIIAINLIVNSVAMLCASRCRTFQCSTSKKVHGANSKGKRLPNRMLIGAYRRLTI